MEQFRNAGLVENYCRAPEDDDEWPWCYVLSYDVVKQICDIPVCKAGCYLKYKRNYPQLHPDLFFKICLEY